MLLKPQLRQYFSKIYTKENSKKIPLLFPIDAVTERTTKVSLTAAENLFAVRYRSLRFIGLEAILVDV